MLLCGTNLVTSLFKNPVRSALWREAFCKQELTRATNLEAKMTKALNDYFVKWLFVVPRTEVAQGPSPPIVSPEDTSTGSKNTGGGAKALTVKAVP